MTTFSVHMRRANGSSGVGNDPIVVREGFSVVAFLLGPVWFAWRRMWWALAIWTAAVGCLMVLGLFFALGAAALLLTYLVLQAFLALENSALHQAALRRRGYKMVDVVDGTSSLEAELTFFARPISSASKPELKILRARSRPPEDIGIFLQEEH